MAVIFSHRPCLLHTLRERIIRRGALKVTALRATTDSPLPDFSTVLNRDRTQCPLEIRDSQPHVVWPSGPAAARCSTGAWLYRLAIRENSTASVTHRSGTQGESCATTAALSAPVLNAGNTSPHLAPLFRRAGLRSAYLLPVVVAIRDFIAGSVPRGAGLHRHVRGRR